MSNMEKENKVEYIIRHTDGSVSYDVERFASLYDAELAEFKSGERTIERLENILLKRLNPEVFVSGKGKSTWKKFVAQIYESYSKAPDECRCIRLEKEILKDGVDKYSVSLANTNYGGADIMARKHDDGSINYCIAVYADGIDYSDNMLYCPFCGKKLKRRWK